MTKHYEIGQVIYIVTKKSTVVPLQVVEINTKVTQTGTLVSYVVYNGATKTNIGLDEIDSVAVYESLHDAETCLFDDVTKVITKIIANAREKEIEWYSVVDPADMTT